MDGTPLSDTPRAPKLSPRVTIEPEVLWAALAEVGPAMRQVIIESPDDGAVSHLVGPFLDDEAAQAWAAAFIRKYDWDKDFITVREVWDLTPPDSPEIEEFYG